MTEFNKNTLRESLANLIGSRIESIAPHDVMDSESILYIETEIYSITAWGNWRLLKTGSIILGTREPEPRYKDLQSTLLDKTLVDIDCNDKNCDLTITFENGIELQILSNSSTYETWDIVNNMTKCSLQGFGDGDAHYAGDKL